MTPLGLHLICRNFTQEKNDGKTTFLTAAVITCNKEGRILDRHFTFWQQLQDKNLTGAWKDAATYTFAIYGEADIAAINPNFHQGTGRFFLLPETEHGKLLA